MDTIFFLTLKFFVDCFRYISGTYRWPNFVFYNLLIRIPHFLKYATLVSLVHQPNKH